MCRSSLAATPDPHSPFASPQPLCKTLHLAMQGPACPSAASASFLNSTAIT